MVKIVLEGNKKDIETIRKILDEYVMISFSRNEHPLFCDNGELRQILKIKMPNEIWDE